MNTDKLIGKPNALKQVNLSMVRRAIREAGSATRSEVVSVTKIGATTVRKLLTEMLNNHEIAEIGYDDSVGGRKAVRYGLNKECFFGVALCLDGDAVHYLVVNICGEVCDNGIVQANGNLSDSILSVLDGLALKMEIRSVGIGVPGIVSGFGYERKNAEGELEYHPIGENIRSRYGIPVFLENDLKAITLGFGRCYLKTYPEERCETINMAYLHFDRNCLSAGFLSGGRILRGFNNFAGELGLFPASDSRTLDDVLAEPLEEGQYADLVVKLIAMLCCILNPQYVALGGSGFRIDCLPLICEKLSCVLPAKLSAEILYAGEEWHDYYEGMAYLTAEQIFANVRLVKE